MRVLAIRTPPPAHNVGRLYTERLLAEALANVELPVHLVGNGAARYGAQLKAALGKRVRMTENGLGAVPSAAIVARLGRTQLAQGTRPDAALVPVYIRRTEAEVNWDKRLIKSPVARLTP